MYTARVYESSVTFVCLTEVEALLAGCDDTPTVQ
jgi:hypothetical protein